VCSPGALGAFMNIFDELNTKARAILISESK